MMECSRKIIGFHREYDVNGYLSNWYLRDFYVNGRKYSCAEQYMMEQKALLFNDRENAAAVMQTNDQLRMQELGRQVKNFNQIVWDGTKQLIIYKAVFEKFFQNQDLREKLISTGDAILVECSKSDCIWGIGLGMDDQEIQDISKWRGKNLLGFTLCSVRENLKRR